MVTNSNRLHNNEIMEVLIRVVMEHLPSGWPKKMLSIALLDHAIKDATTEHISREYQNLFIYRIFIFVGITNNVTR